MNKYSEYILYEELLGFFDLEGDELLRKMFHKLNEISSNYFNSESFIRNSSGNIVVFLNEYQERIAFMYDTLILLWVWRN